jgi:hypothetical protein
LTGVNVNLANTVAGGGKSLTVNDSWTTTFGNTVSGVNALTTDAAGATAINADVTTTGGQTYNDAVTLGGAGAVRTLTGVNVNLANTIAGGGKSLTVNDSGTTTFGNTVSGVNALTTDAAGTTAINGGSVATTGTQTYNDDVTLGAATTLSSSGAGAAGNITLAKSVNGSQTLAVDTAGTTTFGGTVGNSTPLVSVTTDAPGETDINGGVITTSGAQDYKDPVVLTADAVLTANTITFEKTVDSDGVAARALTLNDAGTTTFAAAVGNNARLASLTTDAAGTTDINGGVVKTTGAQTYNDDVVLSLDTTVDSSGSGNITFSKTVNATAPGAESLTANTAGTTTWGKRCTAGTMSLSAATICPLPRVITTRRPRATIKRSNPSFVFCMGRIRIISQRQESLITDSQWHFVRRPQIRNTHQLRRFYHCSSGN